jgi:ribose transport system substrate-binding protein
VVAAPVDSLAVAPYLQQLIWSGAYVGTVVPPPAVTILNAPQYLTGKVLGDEAAAYIRTKLKCAAKVVLLTYDSLQFFAPRFTAMRDSLRSLPGAVIVADISPSTVNEAGGAAMMRTILLANPDVDVVLGAIRSCSARFRPYVQPARPAMTSFWEASTGAAGSRGNQAAWSVQGQR